MYVYTPSDTVATTDRPSGTLLPHVPRFRFFFFAAMPQSAKDWKQELARLVRQRGKNLVGKDCGVSESVVFPRGGMRSFDYNPNFCW